MTALISVPLTVGYLGTDRYGMWITISSMTALLMIADLGVGNGLLNAVSEVNGRDDREAARKYVSSAFFVLCAIAVALGSIFWILYPWIPWAGIFNVASPLAIAEAGPAMFVFVGCFLVGVPLSVARQTQLGYQEGFAASIWISLGHLLGLGTLLLGISLEAGLPWLVLAMAGPPVAAALANFVVLFVYRHPWLRPRFADVRATMARRISGLGMMFFILQAASVVAYEADNIVVAQIFGAQAVAQYAIPWKLFMLTPMVLGLALMPLWPAYGEAIERGDVAWVRKTLTRSLAVGLLVTVPTATLLVAYGSQVIHLWVGPVIDPPFLLLLGLGLWTILYGISSPLAMLFNGASVVKFQVVCALSMAVANLVMSIGFARLFGLPGVIFGTLTAQVLFILIPYALYLPRLLRHISSRDTGRSATVPEATHDPTGPDGYIDASPTGRAVSARERGQTPDR